LTLIEFMVAVGIIFIFLGVFATHAAIALRIGRETALRNELENIRMSIRYYRVVRGKLPESLIALMDQKISFEDFGGVLLGKGFLKPFRINQEGNLIDPFMNRYYYGKEKGVVYSLTKGYESW